MGYRAGVQHSRHYDLNMAPLAIDFGADGFYRGRLKCAESCPSKSIPAGGKTVVNGIEKWKRDAESCFDFWGRGGTDCSVCMGVCLFNRPIRGIYRLARWMIRRPSRARRVLPHVDNLVYGKRWKPRSAREWIAFPTSVNL
jgi:hypothetical protein